MDDAHPRPATATRPPWPGLTGALPVVPVDYPRIAQLVARLAGELAARAAAGTAGAPIGAVVGIVRGGVVPATMFAQRLGTELHLLRVQRHVPQAEWLGMPPPAGSAVLLVDDIASRGDTLQRARAFVEAAGCAVTTAALFVDRARCAAPPDVALDAPGFVRFPWDRRETTPAARALIAEREWLRPGDEREFVGVDMDGILLRDLHRHHYRRDLAAALTRRAALPPRPAHELPALHWPDCHVVTGRPRQDEAVTRAWLDRHGFAGCGLACRDASRHADTLEGAVAHKAETLLRLGVSLYLESELRQAALLAEACPTVDIVWWGRHRQLLIGGVSGVAGLRRAAG